MKLMKFTLLCVVGLLVGSATGQIGEGRGEHRPLTLKEKAERNGGSIHVVHEPDSLPQSLQDIVKAADDIVIGTVIDSQSELTASGYAVITKHRVSIASVLKGESAEVRPGAMLMFTQLGGVVTDGAARIEYEDANTPLLVKGKTYLLIGFRRAGNLSLYGPAVLRLGDSHASCVSKRARSFSPLCGATNDDIVRVLTEAARLRQEN